MFCLFGRLAKTPELCYTPTQTPLTEVIVSIFNAGKKVTEFIPVTLWGTKAEEVCAQCTKGSSILLQGNIRKDKWKDKKTGKWMAKLTLNSNRVEFIADPANRKDKRLKEIRDAITPQEDYYDEETEF